MIARFWRGVTPESKSNEYFEYLKSTGVKDAQSIKGNKGVMVLRRVSEGQAEFLVISLWDSMDAVRKFAGDDIDASRYFPADSQYLLSLEPEVTHYDVLLSP
jgi:heme-degrading monooxygenase HmoA